MKATLFENDIETYKDALKRNGVYELSDTTVRPLQEQYRSRPDEEYQITLGGHMRVRALNVLGCDDTPKYRRLADIPSVLAAEEPLLGNDRSSKESLYNDNIL